MREELLAPGRGALGARGQVAGLTRARIAKTHRKQRDLVRVVENGGRDAQPVA